MTGGFTGKILRLNLTNRSASIMDTSKYEVYAGGIGMGTAIFWELCGDKLPMDALDPRNVLTLIPGPLAGTLVPGASRIEMNGIGPQAYPIGWFTRGNMGGRFAAQMKYAGWDGIVMEGAADAPVWVNIVNDQVTFEDASSLWGMDAWTVQQRIWAEVMGTVRLGAWRAVGDTYTTQRPAVACIGPLGEVKARDLGVILTDAGSAIGNCGFGAVWGAKNLKAISVIGTGSVEVADPAALYEARMWLRRFVDRPDVGHPLGEAMIARSEGGVEKGPHVQGLRGPGGTTIPFGDEKFGPQSCISCPFACRIRVDTVHANDSHCIDGAYYTKFIKERYTSDNVIADKRQEAAGISQKWGASCIQLQVIIPWLAELNKMGVVGPDKAIKTDLPFGILGDPRFIEVLLEQVVRGEGIGLELREGVMRTAEKFGRLEPDLKSGILNCDIWGFRTHGDARRQPDWGFYSILADRDINEHSMRNVIDYFNLNYFKLGEYPVPVEELVDIMTEKLIPFQGDPLMLDSSLETVYSIHMVKLVAWQTYYSRFWKEGVNFCDWGWPDFVNVSMLDHRGCSPEGETKFYNAVTGKSITFAEGMEIGRKVWNWNNAIWTLQGRHRDMVKFSDFLYELPKSGERPRPVFEDGQWVVKDTGGRVVDRDKFEEFKTLYYEFEGWDTKTGWPTRKTLEELDLKDVADTLESAGRLGSPS